MSSPAQTGLHNQRQDLSVTVSVRSRFHAFDLAGQLHRRGALRQLITPYPKFKVREWGIPDSEITSLPHYEAANRLLPRMPFSTAFKTRAEIWLASHFDRSAARRIPDGTRLFVGWSGSARESMLRAKSMGAKTVLERGSTHIAFQDSILREAYADAGLDWPGLPSEFIDTEEREYAGADFISVPTRFVRDTFIERGIASNRIIVVPYGCNLSVFGPRPKEDTKFRIIHCGQISIRKGIHTLVQAFAELCLPNAELWLIGALRPETESILRRYQDSAVFVKGPFAQNSLPNYYAQGSVFCIASFEEGMAMVIPQAMSCGLPVIGTFNSGAADIVEEGRTGFVIPAGDVEALKEKLLLLYSHPEVRDEMAANLSNKKRTDISWDAYGERITQAYRNIVCTN